MPPYTPPPRGEVVLHERKTLVATSGVPWIAATPEDVFTITGRVFIHRITAFCTENLAGTGEIALGDATDADAYVAATEAVNLDLNEWWSATPAASSINIDVSDEGGQTAHTASKVTSADIIVTVTNEDITDGTIIFDIWYSPVTDNGALAAA